MVDTDGNTVLDLGAAQSGMPIGYNANDLLFLRMANELDRFVTNRVNSAVPPADMADIIRENVMVAAPPGTTQVSLSAGSTGAEANEHAIAEALKYFAKKHNIADLSSVCVLGFENSLHGTTTATLSCSSTEANEHGLPAFPWPRAEFPQLKYPLYKNDASNRAEEDRCIEAFKNTIGAKRAEGGHVGAIIVEPMSGLHQQMATPYFYRAVRRIAKAEGIPFIVDETRTGIGASGKAWGHEYWYLHDDEKPDYVSFGGARASGLAGFYSSVDHRLAVTPAAQAINMVNLLSYGRVWKTIAEQNLLHK